MNDIPIGAVYETREWLRDLLEELPDNDPQYNSIAAAADTLTDIINDAVIIH